MSVDPERVNDSFQVQIRSKIRNPQNLQQEPITIDSNWITFEKADCPICLDSGDDIYDLGYSEYFDIVAPIIFF